MILYNLSNELLNTSTLLQPYIPYTAAKDEDKSISRICVAPSIELCVQAMSPIARPTKKDSLFLLHIIDINEDEVISPQELFENKLVPDALENQEHWILEPVRCKTYLCKMNSFDHEFDISWSCVDLTRVEDIISNVIPDFIYEKSDYTNSRTLYNDAMEYCMNNELFAETDDIWDEIVEDPIAQKTSIQNVKYDVLKEYF